MAITSAIMQMRRGEEEYFDPDKMHPGEWAVSTDTKYVRMCFSPGVCVRMATYEAFEEDMEQIISILEEANTVKEAIEEIYKEFQEAELDIEAAENSAILSESYARGGTGKRDGEDTDNAKYYAEQARMAGNNVYSLIYKYGVTADGVTDDTEAIQNFINDNAGNVLFFPEGTYRIANNIKIPSDTTLIGYGATILFEANNAMINDSDGTIGGTDANKNINIVGFTFIANTIENTTTIGFSHANNCKIIDCNFSNNAGWHMIEINSCDNVEIKSCVFKEYGILRDGTVSSGTKTEMVQVDYAYGASGFPWFGPYDRTPCTNVYIDKCSFYGDINARCAAVGNHAYEDGDVEVIKNVYITDCYVCDSSSLLKYVVGNNFFVDHCIAENMNYGVYGSSYTKDAYITNNIFIGDNGESGGYGIAYSTSDISKEADCMKNINVKNNVVEYFGYLGIKVDGYNNIIENNVIKNNGDSGILVGQNNYNTIIKGNVIENNNSRDVRLNALDSVLYGIIGGITLRDNKIESLISWCGVTPNTTSYMVNNIIDTSASTSGYSGLVRTNNIVGGVLES